MLRSSLFWCPIVVLLAVAATSRAVDYNRNVNGNWNLNTTWTPNGIPGAADNANTLNFQTVVSDTQSINNINITTDGANDFNIMGTGNFTIFGAGVWTGSNNEAFRVDGVLNINGTLSLAPASRRFQGTGTINVNNGGILSYDRAVTDSFELFDGAKLVIHDGGTFRFTQQTESGLVGGRGFEFRQTAGLLDLKSGGKIQVDLPGATQIASLDNFYDGSVIGGTFNIDTGGTLEVLNGELESTFGPDKMTVNGAAPTTTLAFNVRLIDNDGVGANAATLDMRGFTSSFTTIGANATLEMSGPHTSFVNNTTDLLANLSTVEGTLLVSNGKTLTPGGGTLTVQNGGVVGGHDGFINGTLVIASGGTDSPGNSVGLATADNVTWLPSGTFKLQIDNATGVAGGPGGWDLRVVDAGGTLDISNLTAASFTVELESLLLSSDTPGQLLNFDETQNYEWEFITSDTIAGTFSPDLFNIDASAFLALNPGAANGIFGIAQTENGLAITYDYQPPVPEPATIAGWLVLGLGALAVTVCRNRFKKRS